MKNYIKIKFEKFLEFLCKVGLLIDIEKKCEDRHFFYSEACVIESDKYTHD